MTTQAHLEPEPIDSQESVDPGVGISVLQDLYRENAESYRYFLEWRHKILLRYFFVIGASLVLASAVIARADELPQLALIAAPTIALLGSVMSFLLDNRNAVVAGNATRIGAELERRILALAHVEQPLAEGPFYSKLVERENVYFTYTRTLRWLYVLSAAVSLVSLILVFLHVMEEPPTRLPSEIDASPEPGVNPTPPSGE